MRVDVARGAAADWVARHARTRAGFRGAYFSGSTVGLAPGALLPPSSDVDVVVVREGDEAPPKPGKLRHGGALLEVTYEPWSALDSAERVLGSYHLAGPFTQDTVIEDPTGHLGRLRDRVARDFADRVWVRRRCAEAAERVRGRLTSPDEAAPFHEQVMNWLFPTGVTTHVLLVAALRNPTIRLRYPAARQVLSDFGHLELYPELLADLGCARLGAARVRRHLAALTTTFDVTAGVRRSSFPFGSDLTSEARPLAIDGSAELIARGLHREAVFWIVATFTRCHTVLAADAPAEHLRLLPAFTEVLEELGLDSPQALRRRAAHTVGELLPRVEEVAEAIMGAHSGIAR